MDALFNSYDIISSKNLSRVNYDKTINCIITNIDKREQGIYKVKNDNFCEFEACSENLNYELNDSVQVVIPLGDYNSTKRIIGKIDNNISNEVKEYKNALFNYTPLTENLLNKTELNEEEINTEKELARLQESKEIYTNSLNQKEKEIYDLEEEKEKLEVEYVTAGVLRKKQIEIRLNNIQTDLENKILAKESDQEYLDKINPQINKLNTISKNLPDGKNIYYFNLKPLDNINTNYKQLGLSFDTEFILNLDNNSKTVNEQNDFIKIREQSIKYGFILKVICSKDEASANNLIKKLKENNIDNFKEAINSIELEEKNNFYITDLQSDNEINDLFDMLNNKASNFTMFPEDFNGEQSNYATPTSQEVLFNLENFGYLCCFELVFLANGLENNDIIRINNLSLTMGLDLTSDEYPTGDNLLLFSNLPNEYSTVSKNSGNISALWFDKDENNNITFKNDLLTTQSDDSTPNYSLHWFRNTLDTSLKSDYTGYFWEDLNESNLNKKYLFYNITWKNYLKKDSPKDYKENKWFLKNGRAFNLIETQEKFNEIIKDNTKNKDLYYKEKITSVEILDKYNDSVKYYIKRSDDIKYMEFIKNYFFDSYNLNEAYYNILLDNYLQQKLNYNNYNSILKNFLNNNIITNYINFLNSFNFDDHIYLNSNLIFNKEQPFILSDIEEKTSGNLTELIFYSPKIYLNKQEQGSLQKEYTIDQLQEYTMDQLINDINFARNLIIENNLNKNTTDNDLLKQEISKINDKIGEFNTEIKKIEKDLKKIEEDSKETEEDSKEIVTISIKNKFIENIESLKNTIDNNINKNNAIIEELTNIKDSEINDIYNYSEKNSLTIQKLENIILLYEEILLLLNDKYNEFLELKEQRFESEQDKDIDLNEIISKWLSINNIYIKSSENNKAVKINTKNQLPVFYIDRFDNNIINYENSDLWEIKVPLLYENNNITNLQNNNLMNSEDDTSIKAIILDKSDNIICESNILNFKNLSKIVTNNKNIDTIQNLVLIDKQYNGNYFIYNQNGYNLTGLTYISLNGTFDCIKSGNDNIDFSDIEISFRVPSVNTMIDTIQLLENNWTLSEDKKYYIYKDTISLKENVSYESLEIGEYFTYDLNVPQIPIQNFYNSNLTNNFIECIVLKNNYEDYYKLNLNFNKKGSSGTQYSFRIVPVDSDKSCFIKGKIKNNTTENNTTENDTIENDTIDLKAVLIDPNGLEITPNNVKWEFYKKNYGKNNVYGFYNSSTKQLDDSITGNPISIKIKDTSNFNFNLNNQNFLKYLQAIVSAEVDYNVNYTYGNSENTTKSTKFIDYFPIQVSLNKLFKAETPFTLWYDHSGNCLNQEYPLGMSYNNQKINQNNLQELLESLENIQKFEKQYNTVLKNLGSEDAKSKKYITDIINIFKNKQEYIKYIAGATGKQRELLNQILKNLLFIASQNMYYPTPVLSNFDYGNTEKKQNYIEDTLDLINSYQKKYPNEYNKSDYLNNFDKILIDIKKICEYNEVNTNLKNASYYYDSLKKQLVEQSKTDNPNLYADGVYFWDVQLIRGNKYYEDSVLNPDKYGKFPLMDENAAISLSYPYITLCKNTVKKEITNMTSVLRIPKSYSSIGNNFTNINICLICYKIISIDSKKNKDGTTEEKINAAPIWATPLIYLSDAYGYDWINEWDGSTIVDTQNRRILTSVLAAGEKDSSNQFTGTIIGAIKENKNNNEQTYVILSQNNGQDVFSVTKEGKVFAKEAEIEGKIIAQSGKIANFEISGTEKAENGFLKNSISAVNRYIKYIEEDNKTYVTDYAVFMRNAGSYNTVAFGIKEIDQIPLEGKIKENEVNETYPLTKNDWAQTDNYNFYIRNDGKLYAKNANIIGGEIGGWTIISNMLYIKADASNSIPGVGMSSGSSGVRDLCFWAGYEPSSTESYSPLQETKYGNKYPTTHGKTKITEELINKDFQTLIKYSSDNFSTLEELKNGETKTIEPYDITTPVTDKNGIKYTPKYDDKDKKNYYITIGLTKYYLSRIARMQNTEVYTVRFVYVSEDNKDAKTFYLEKKCKINEISSIKDNLNKLANKDTSEFMIFEDKDWPSITSFYVLRDGTFKANKAVIEGEITAQSGKIANFEISGTKEAENGFLKNSISAVNRYIKYVEEDNKTYTYATDYAVFMRNAESYDTAAFGVKEIHKDPLKGKIKENEVNEIYPLTENDWAQTNNYNFYIRNDGKLYAKNADIRGTIYASAGNVGGWTISSNMLYIPANFERTGVGMAVRGVSDSNCAFWAGYDPSNANCAVPWDEASKGTYFLDQYKQLDNQSKSFKIFYDANNQPANFFNSWYSRISNPSDNSYVLYNKTKNDVLEFTDSSYKTLYIKKGGYYYFQKTKYSSSEWNLITRKELNKPNLLTNKTAYFKSNHGPRSIKQVIPTEGNSYYEDQSGNKRYDLTLKVGISDPSNNDKYQHYESDSWKELTSFYVLRDGTFKASNAIIEGDIWAKKLRLGDDGSDLKSQISSTVNSSYIEGKITEDGKVVLKDTPISGTENKVERAFKVSKNGLLTATNAIITGRITATEGFIGNFEISKGYLMNDHFYINPDGGIGFDPDKEETNFGTWSISKSGRACFGHKIQGRQLDIYKETNENHYWDIKSSTQSALSILGTHTLKDNTVLTGAIKFQVFKANGEADFGIYIGIEKNTKNLVLATPSEIKKIIYSEQ